MAKSGEVWTYLVPFDERTREGALCEDGVSSNTVRSNDLVHDVQVSNRPDGAERPAGSPEEENDVPKHDASPCTLNRRKWEEAGRGRGLEDQGTGEDEAICLLPLIRRSSSGATLSSPRPSNVEENERRGDVTIRQCF